MHKSSIVSYFRVIFYLFYDYRKLFMCLFFTKFVKLDSDPHGSIFILIRIRIQKKCWIRIRKKWMRIHSPAEKKVHILLQILHRAGNSLIGFPSESLVFWPKISKWAIRSKKLAIHSFAHFWWVTWGIRSHRSFLVSDLSDSLTFLK